jgi:hypothetical protein
MAQRESDDNSDITEAELSDIAHYLDDDLREQVHSELAPCSTHAYLVRYAELDREGLLNAAEMVWVPLCQRVERLLDE